MELQEIYMSQLSYQNVSTFSDCSGVHRVPRKLKGDPQIQSVKQDSVAKERLPSGDSQAKPQKGNVDH